MTDAISQCSHKLAHTTLLAMDVDGVLTDGGITFCSDGTEQRRFHAHDGLGIVALCNAGIPVVWISGRQSEVVDRRATELGVTVLIQGAKDKAASLVHVAKQLGSHPDNVAYIGDDWNDLPAFAVAGIKIAVQNAVPELLKIADLVTSKCGGHGAVREVVDMILEAQGLTQSALDRYLAGGTERARQ